MLLYIRLLAAFFETDPFLKDLVIYLLYMAVIGTAMWFTKKAPAPINYFLWGVLAIVGLFLTVRFIRGL